jgi:hypothetical protein
MAESSTIKASNLSSYVLGEQEHHSLSLAVGSVRVLCPAESEYRYLEAIRRELDLCSLVGLARSYSGKAPLLLLNLPTFEDVQDSKVMTLILGELIGRCVAYSDYNGSYLTDIRASHLSEEASARTESLSMHNDLSFAADGCRPEHLVLVAHRATGRVPRTLLAPASDILDRLSPAIVAELEKNQFEVRCGGKLAWRYERIRKLSLLERRADSVILRSNFDNITPSALLDSEQCDRAMDAMLRLREAAEHVGTELGHSIMQGQALLIPNDSCLHGREEYATDHCDRLLLRAYVLSPAAIRDHRGSMITLGDF